VYRASREANLECVSRLMMKFEKTILKKPFKNEIKKTIGFCKAIIFISSKIFKDLANGATDFEHSKQILYFGYCFFIA
jgi:hypothetical protein